MICIYFSKMWKFIGGYSILVTLSVSVKQDMHLTHLLADNKISVESTSWTWEEHGQSIIWRRLSQLTGWNPTYECVTETALSHATASKIERTYMRGVIFWNNQTSSAASHCQRWMFITTWCLVWSASHPSSSHAGRSSSTGQSSCCPSWSLTPALNTMTSSSLVAGQQGQVILASDWLT